jgi:hypothetical protein
MSKKYFNINTQIEFEELSLWNKYLRKQFQRHSKHSKESAIKPDY